MNVRRPNDGCKSQLAGTFILNGRGKGTSHGGKLTRLQSRRGLQYCGWDILIFNRLAEICNLELLGGKVVTLFTNTIIKVDHLFTCHSQNISSEYFPAIVLTDHYCSLCALVIRRRCGTECWLRTLRPRDVQRSLNCVDGTYSERRRNHAG
jgi:hypothetical protein